MIGVPSLDVLAFSQPVLCDTLAAVLRAGRGRLAVGWYRAIDQVWQKSAEMELMSAAELNERIQTPTQVCGELDEDEQRLLARKRKNVLLASPAQAVRRPAMLAELGWQRWQAGQVDEARTLSPIYLHDKETIPG
jgi:tRNA threonylcarbamoyladenosine biosynthesis protein TsaB